MRTILLSFSLFIALACSDSGRDGKSNEYNPILPPITQSGANTFGAVINGQVIIPRTLTGYSPPGTQKYGVSYTEDKSYIEITAGDGKATLRGFIYLYIENSANALPIPINRYSIEEGTGQLSASTSNHTLVTVLLYDTKGNAVIYGSVNKTGEVAIIRSDENIISGTFYCKLKNMSNPSDIIDLKDGRFDFTKRTIQSTYFP